MSRQNLIRRKQAGNPRGLGAADRGIPIHIDRLKPPGLVELAGIEQVISVVIRPLEPFGHPNLDGSTLQKLTG